MLSSPEYRLETTDVPESRSRPGPRYFKTSLRSVLTSENHNSCLSLRFLRKAAALSGRSVTLTKSRPPSLTRIFYFFFFEVFGQLVPLG